MKKIFFFCGIFASSFISAQKQFIIPKKDFENKFHYYGSQKSNFKLPDSLQLLINPRSLGKLQFVLPDNTKVYSLPQDNMLCLVPDIKQLNMPNAAGKESFKLLFENKNFPGKIPNAAVPNIIIQRKDTPTQSK